MTKQYLSIDIGSYAVKAAVVSVSKSSTEILWARSYELKSLSENAVRDALRLVLNGDNVPKNVVLSLSYPYIEVERAIIPVMPPDEINEAIKWKIKDKLPFNIDEAVLDFSATEEFTDKDGLKQLAIMIYAIKKSELNKLLSMLEGFQIKVVSVSFAPFDFPAVFSFGKKTDDGITSVVIEIGAAHTYICEYKGEKLSFIRLVPVSSSQITEAMCGVLLSDKGKVELSRNEAEDIKRNYGIPKEGGEMLGGKIKDSQVLALVRPSLERLSSEIKRTFTYYVTSVKGAMPDNIYLAGGGALLKNLRGFLEKELGKEVKNLSLPEGVKGTNFKEPESFLPFAGAVGAVLPSDKKKINLLPYELRAQDLNKYGKIFTRVAGFALFCVLALMYANVCLRVSGYKKQIESSNSHLNVLQEVMSMHGEYVQWSEAVKTIKQGRISVVPMLKALSVIIIDDILLKNLSVDFDGKGVSMSGVLYSTSSVPEEELTRLMERIEDTKYFKDANLSLIRKDYEENTAGRTVYFEINFQIEL